MLTVSTRTPDNLFRRDALLLGLTKRSLPQDAYLLLAPKIENFAEEVGGRVREWGAMAELYEPRLENYDAFGNRIDKLHLSPGWRKLKEFAALNRLVAMGYDKKLRQGRRPAQTVMQILFSAYSSTHSCPLAMTDGVVKVLMEHAPQSIREQVIPELLGKELTCATAGQWMTEKSGGSDLRAIETQATFARKEDDKEIYRLYGLKWFASSIDSEYALVLAQVPDAGPSLFLVKVWQGRSLSDGIRIDRLKNKLGTRALATAEVRLEGALGTLIGIKGKGILCASPLLNITRFYNALASASSMNRAYFTALDYALLRQSFKKPLIEHPLHRQSLADIDAKRAGAITLCFEMAQLLSKQEENTASLREEKFLRALIPIAKIVLAKWAVLVASDAMEAMGGIGYLEDLELAQLLRDAQVLPIWEGTTNILVHDLLRAESKDNALVSLLHDLCERSNAVMIDEADALRILRTRLEQISVKVMAALNKSDGKDTMYLLPWARKCAFMVGTCTMALLLAEAKPFITEPDRFAATRFTTFVENNLCGHFSL